MAKLEDSKMELDMKKDSDKQVFAWAVRELFRKNGWNALRITHDTLPEYLKDPNTGDPVVHPQKEKKYLSAIADLMLDWYGAKLREFHWELNIKKKYWFTDFHFNFITQHKNVQTAIINHSRQYQWDWLDQNGKRDDDFELETILEEQNVVKVDNQKADKMYKVQVEKTIERLTKEKETEKDEVKLTKIEESLEKLWKILSWLTDTNG